MAERGNRPGRRLWAWGVGAALMVGLWGAAIAGTPLTVPVTEVYLTRPLGEIRAGQTAGQTFRAPYNGLIGIDVSVADYGRENSGPVLFTLKPAPESAAILALDRFPAENIRGDAYATLRFERLADSAGRSFYFELSAPQAQAGHAITAYLQPYGEYADGQAYWAGLPQDGDLVFVLHFEVPAWERIWIWLEQVTAGKPAPWNQAWLYVLGGAVALGLTGWLLVVAGAGVDGDSQI